MFHLNLSSSPCTLVSKSLMCDFCATDHGFGFPKPSPHVSRYQTLYEPHSFTAIAIEPIDSHYAYIHAVEINPERQSITVDYTHKGKMKKYARSMRSKNRAAIAPISIKSIIRQEIYKTHFPHFFASARKKRFPASHNPPRRSEGFLVFLFPFSLSSCSLRR